MLPTQSLMKEKTRAKLEQEFASVDILNLLECVVSEWELHLEGRRPNSRLQASLSPAAQRQGTLSTP